MYHSTQEIQSDLMYQQGGINPREINVSPPASNPSYPNVSNKLINPIIFKCIKY